MEERQTAEERLARLAPQAAGIVRTALERGIAAGVPYAGMVTPAEAHALLGVDGVQLIDTRSRAEWVWVGRVPGSRLVSWAIFDGEALRANPRFIEELKETAQRDDVLLFLCRTVNRSKSAAEAATLAGFPWAFEILEGFEGELDRSAHRGRLNGWRHLGLPWRQD